MVSGRRRQEVSGRRTGLAASFQLWALGKGPVSVAGLSFLGLHLRLSLVHANSHGVALMT